MKILFITSNQAKVTMSQERLAQYGITVEQRTLPLYEIQSLDIHEVANSKAEQAALAVQEPFIIEDSAFYIPALHNFPGTLIKLVFDSLGEDRVTDLVKHGENRSVLVVSQLIYYSKGDGPQFFQGVYKGTLSDSPRGEHMRGWRVTRVFIPEGHTETLAEMDEAEWQNFLDEFRANDHFEKFGQWLSSKNKVK